jgi:hypothetical protein
MSTNEATSTLLRLASGELPAETDIVALAEAYDAAVTLLEVSAAALVDRAVQLDKEHRAKHSTAHFMVEHPVYSNVTTYIRAALGSKPFLARLLGFPPSQLSSVAKAVRR